MQISGRPMPLRTRRRPNKRRHTRTPRQPWPRCPREAFRCPQGVDSVEDTRRSSLVRLARLRRRCFPAPLWVRLTPRTAQPCIPCTLVFLHQRIRCLVWVSPRRTPLAPRKQRRRFSFLRQVRSALARARFREGWIRVWPNRERLLPLTSRVVLGARQVRRQPP